jgi:hypothetical protein
MPLEHLTQVRILVGLYLICPKANQIYFQYLRTWEIQVSNTFQKAFLVDRLKNRKMLLKTGRAINLINMADKTLGDFTRRIVNYINEGGQLEHLCN